MYKKNAIKQQGLDVEPGQKLVAIHRTNWPVAESFYAAYHGESHTDSNTKMTGVAKNMTANGFDFNGNFFSDTINAIDFSQGNGVLAGGLNKALAANLDLLFVGELANSARDALFKIIIVACRYGVGWKQLKQLILDLESVTTVTVVQKNLLKYMFNVALTFSCANQIVTVIGLFGLSGPEATAAKAAMEAIQKGVLLGQPIKNGQKFFAWPIEIKTEYLVAIRTPFFTLKKIYVLGTLMLINKISATDKKDQATVDTLNNLIKSGEYQMGQGLRNTVICFISTTPTRIFNSDLPANVQILLPVLTYLPCFAGEIPQTSDQILKILYQFSILSIYMQVTYQNDAKNSNAMNSKFKFGGLVSRALKVDPVFTEASNDLQDNGYESVLQCLMWDKFKEADLDQLVMNEAERDMALQDVVGKKVPNVLINYADVMADPVRLEAQKDKEEKLIKFILRENKKLDEEHKYEEPGEVQPQNRKQ